MKQGELGGVLKELVRHRLLRSCRRRLSRSDGCVRRGVVPRWRRVRGGARRRPFWAGEDYPPAQDS